MMKSELSVETILKTRVEYAKRNFKIRKNTRYESIAETYLSLCEEALAEHQAQKRPSNLWQKAIAFFTPKI